MASRPFQFREKKHFKIGKSAAKHFEGLAALSIHSAERRAAVKAGCKPVHFSLDGCPLSCYFSESVATTSGHFVHKSERITHYTLLRKVVCQMGALPPLETPTRKGGTLPPPRGAYRLFLLSSPPAVSVEQKSA